MPVTRITKRAIEVLQPRSTAYVVYDSGLVGFGVRVNPTGAKSFLIEYRPGSGGRRVAKKRIVIGQFGKMTCEQARNVAREKLASVQLGNDPAADRAAQRTTPTFKETAGRYLQEEAPRRLKSSTITNYEINLRRHANPAIGSFKIADITRQDIIALHNRIGGKSPVTANRVLETISGVFRFAQEAGIVPDGQNPTVGIRAFKEKRRERYLSEDEFIRLGQALRLAETEGIPWAYRSNKAQSKHAVKADNQKTVFSSVATDAIRMLIFTGCRLREVLGLTWQEVALERGLLFLSDSKTGARAVVLNQQAMDILMRQYRSGPFVFPSDIPKLTDDGELIDRSLADLKKPWAAIRRHAGLEDVRLHDLRHSFASVGASAGMGLPIVGALLGHKQAATTERYAHLDASPLRTASDKIATHIATALNGGSDHIAR